MAATATPTRGEYRHRAEELAKLAHEGHFEQRGGVWPVKDLNCVCHFNNNPYAADRDLRGRMVEAFRMFLGSLGIEELAFATYPNDGESAGYSFAMLIDVEPAKVDHVEFILSEFGFPMGSGGLGSTFAAIDAEEAHALIGGVPFNAKVLGAGGLRDGYEMMVLTEPVGDYREATGDYFEDPAKRYFAAGSLVIVRIESERHPTTGRRQGTVLGYPNESLPERLQAKT